MKLVILMIVLPALALFILVSKRPGAPSPARPEPAQNSSAAIVQSPDRAALERIQREHASGRFPFLVSSLCRDFLARYPTSPHRAEVERILDILPAATPNTGPSVPDPEKKKETTQR